MLSPRSALLLLLPLVALTGCESGSLCGRVRCESGRVCNPVNGACIVDTSKKDGGSDAGLDAGVDAGRTCAPACGAGKVCDPVSIACVGCLSNADCSCPNPTCDLASHTCIPPDDAGFPTTVLGDSCAAATLLPFPVCQNATRFQVDLGPFKDDEEGTCSVPSSLGHDAVFLVEVDAGYDLRVTATAAPGGTADPIIYLRSTPCATGNERVCVDALGTPSSFRANSLPPGEYAVVIDSFDPAGSGPVDVTVQLLQSNDTCSSLVPAPTDGGSFTVDLSEYGDDLVGGCNSFPNSRESVWRVVLDTASDFRAIATAVDPDGGVDPVLYLRRSPCATGAEVTCVDTSGSSDLLVARNLPAGTYFLVVEGYGTAGSSGPVSVTSWASPPIPPPANDTCAGARPITFPAGATSVSFPVDTTNANDDAQGSCSTAFGGGPELVYRLTLPAAHTVSITAQQAAGSSTDPVIYLRKGACAAVTGLDGGSDAGSDFCSDDPSSAAAIETIYQPLAAGDYYLFVDNYDAFSAGPAIVTVTLDP